MTVTREEVEQKRRELEEAERAYQTDVRSRREGVVRRLNVMRANIDDLVREAQQLAETADLVFYYSSGYEEWSWTEKENWSSSSANC